MDKRPNDERSALEHSVPAMFYFISRKMVQELLSKMFIKMDSMSRSSRQRQKI